VAQVGVGGEHREARLAMNWPAEASVVLPREERWTARLPPLGVKVSGREIQREAFTHTYGLVSIPVLVALKEGAIPDLMLRGSATVAEMAVHARLAGKATVNTGYLHAVLRTLVSVGWAVRRGAPGCDELSYTLTRSGRAVVGVLEKFERVVSFLPMATRMDAFLMGESVPDSPVDVDGLAEGMRRSWDLPSDMAPGVRESLIRQVDGILVGPVMVALKDAGVLDRIKAAGGPVKIEDFKADTSRLKTAFRILEQTGWTVVDGESVSLTAAGVYAASKAWCYGTMVSYAPLMAGLPELLYGDPAKVFARDDQGHERHVRRDWNVKGSGASHLAYFAKADEILRQVFDETPIREQPRFVADMGCGDGSLLRHVWEVLQTTRRGRLMKVADRVRRRVEPAEGDEALLAQLGLSWEEVQKDPARYDLQMVGADFNERAREETRKTLTTARIAHEVLFGDIANPNGFAQDLRKIGLNIEDGLHMRSFLDHNAPWATLTADALHAAEGRTARSSGAYSDKGRTLPNTIVEQRYVEHFRAWAPHVRKHGLLAIELHHVPPELSARLSGRTLEPSYGTVHDLSDQYILDLPAYEAILREVGLQADPDSSFRFPDNDAATISVRYFKDTRGTAAT
jgi:hypothetical protein